MKPNLMVLSVRAALLPPTLTSRYGTGSASPTTNRSLTSRHPRVGNQWRSSWSLRFPCQLHSLLIGGTVILSIFPLEPCVHEPRVALKLGCFCVHFQEKKAPACHRGLNGELRHHTVTSGIWLICRRIFTDNCN